MRFQRFAAAFWKRIWLGLPVTLTICIVFIKASAAQEKPAISPNNADKAESVTRQLLSKLKEQNTGRVLFTDPWLQTLKDLVEQGQAAVPELIEELDASNDDRMLRCLGFILRAIDDKRAVPALIRAIPKTLRPPSSDMGLVAKDPELSKFAHTHQLNPDNRRDEHYSFGRPVREICAALEKLTATNHGDEELFNVFLYGSAAQRERKIDFFGRKAEVWSNWWEEHWAEHVEDKEFSKVGLPVRKNDDVIARTPVDGSFKTVGRSSNWILESYLNPDAKHVFYDFDVGRAGALPEKWRKAPDIGAHLDEITFWAIREGYDLMGTEHETVDGRKYYALRSLAMSVWQLPDARWKMSAHDIKLKMLQDEGQEPGKLLLHYAKSNETADPDATSTYLFITRHGTPGLLFVGIEVQDDSLKPGGRFDGDDELNPIAFNKGRRFGFSLFEEINPK